MQSWLEINLVVGGGWSPETLYNMSMEDFLYWYEAAIEINKKQCDSIKQS